MAVGWCAKSSIMVMPLTSAFTSRRRFTLLKLFKALAMTFGETPLLAARAAAALAFQTLYSPARGNSNSAHSLPSCSSDQDVLAGANFTSAIRQVASVLAP